MRPLIFMIAALASIAPACAETGLASFYGPREEGRPMANGHPFHTNGINAASRSYPLGTRLLVTNLINGRQAEVVIEDRGPYIKPRILDVSRGTARMLGFEHRGVTMVRIEPAPAVVIRPAVFRYRVRPEHHHRHRCK